MSIRVDCVSLHGHLSVLVTLLLLAHHLGAIRIVIEQSLSYYAHCSELVGAKV